MRAFRVMAIGVASVSLLFGCGGDTASDGDAGVNSIDGGVLIDAAPGFDASPCPSGQELVGEVCVTPNESGSPFLCTVPPVVPCGGDVVGTWQFVDSCEFTPHFNPFATSCGEDEIATHFFYIEYEGTLSFTVDGSYTDQHTPTRHSVSDMPMTCGGYNDCDRLANSFGLGVCTQVDDRCECVDDGRVGELENYGDPYSIVGNEIIFGTGDQGSPYCVDGDTLYIERLDVDVYEPLKLQRM